MNIGERIKKRRQELGYSVDDIAKYIGKNRATIYRYESSEIEDLPTSVLEPLAKALHTTPAYLMGWNESIESNISDKLKQQLLHNYDKMNETAQNTLVKYSEFMVSQPENLKIKADNNKMNA